MGAQSPQLEQARRLVETERYAEAKQILKPLGSADHEAAFLLGKIALLENDAPAAVDWLEKSVRINSRSSEYYDWLGKAYGTQAQTANKLRQATLAKKTKSAWEKAIALDPNNLEAKQDMVSYYLQAPGFLGGSKEKAKAMALEVRARSPYRGAFVVAQVCGATKGHACVEREFRSDRTDCVTPLKVEHSHALHVATMPDHHRDPFDRLLIAQALLEDATLITADRQFELYGIPTRSA